jgi:phage terminase Nu1 subunit (DNA packaging protein)
MATYATMSEATMPMNELPKVNASLNSWKEIAVFLGRGVRTVQRWERELGLPVHRIRETEHSPVFAFASELRKWLERRGKAGVRKPPSPSDALPSAEPERRPQLEPPRLLAQEILKMLAEQAKATEQLRHSLEMTIAVLDLSRMGKNAGSIFPAEE